MTKTPAICIHTKVPAAQIIAEGGSGNWLINAKRMKKVDYAVLCYLGGLQRDAAFIVGRIRNILASSEPGRKFVEFEEYAIVDIPNTWPGHQNSINYVTLEELGVDLDDLTWNSLPAISKGHNPNPSPAIYTIPEEKTTVDELIEQLKSAFALKNKTTAENVSVAITLMG